MSDKNKISIRYGRYDNIRPFLYISVSLVPLLSLLTTDCLPTCTFTPSSHQSILKISRLEQEVLVVSNMAKRPAMHTPAPKGEKAPRLAPQMRASEESTVRYVSGYVSKSGGIQNPDERKMDQLEKLLCQARELACVLLAAR